MAKHTNGAVVVDKMKCLEAMRKYLDFDNVPVNDKTIANGPEINDSIVIEG